MGLKYPETIMAVCLIYTILIIFIAVFLLIPGQSQPLFLEEKQADIKLINISKIKNVKIDFFILS